MESHSKTRIRTRLQLDGVYTIGAAGFWLERFQGDTRERRENLLARLVDRLTKRNLREIRRRTDLFTRGAGSA